MIDDESSCSSTENKTSLKIHVAVYTRNNSKYSSTDNDSTYSITNNASRPLQLHVLNNKHVIERCGLTYYYSMRTDP